MLKKKKSFSDLGLSIPILNALSDLGYKNPSPIQIACIPYLLSGYDVLGIAQTGSGKTAAFALPFLQKVNSTLLDPQMLIISPTRELALQVCNACSEFIKYIDNIKVIALYGGQKFYFMKPKDPKQVIVCTPGRLLDHLRRKTLNFSNLKFVVLDEADEMLRMGFIEDVNHILSKVPKNRQMALFSATMPEEILRITRRFMKKPKEVFIKSTISNIPNIDQNYWMVRGIKKNEALIRFLEIENFNAVIIFVKTKNVTFKISTMLERIGYKSAPLNGDMKQYVREKTLDHFKTGKLNILIATDVAARGLDIQRINLVINYDAPTSSEYYIHRIGRTGRAGRIGKSILFIEYWEKKLLFNIKKIVKFNIKELKLPNNQSLIEKRLNKFSEKLKKQINETDLDKYLNFVNKLKLHHKLNIEMLSAILLKMASSDFPLVLPKRVKKFKKCSNKKKNILNFDSPVKK